MQVSAKGQIQADQHHQHVYDPPSLAITELAAASSRVLAGSDIVGETVRLSLIDYNTTITLPARAIYTLADILNEMALGRAVSVVLVNQELTTREAADLLNGEQAYLIDDLLSTGGYYRSI